MSNRIQAAGLAGVLMCSVASAQTNVATYHNDNARTGQYLSEVLLTPGTVAGGSFGKRFSYPVDGTVYAQPLYLSRVSIPGRGLRDLVIVATAHNSIYAFDADGAGNGMPVWQVSLMDAASGATTVPVADVNCPVIGPELGIIGTPVIDAAAGTIYAIAETKEPGPTYVLRLHALDVTTGAERAGSPAVLQLPDFKVTAYKQRGALLLANGTIYSGWSSNCDHGSYHGWILAHDAVTLNPVATYNASATGNAGSFWNGGAGPAADAAGTVFAVSANGDFDATVGGSSYGDSVLRLNPANLTVEDYFNPFNQTILDANDLDLGSSGSLLLPDEAGSTEHPHVLFTSGKEGRLYLLDRDHLGGAQFSQDDAALASLPVLGQATFGMAAWFNGAVYVASEFSPLRSFAVSAASMDSKPAATGPAMLQGLGATPSISANGSQGGVVWLIGSDTTLQAYDATNLGLLFSSGAGGADALNSYVEFAVPTAANGRVYAGTQQTVDVYGAGAAATPMVQAVTNAASYSAVSVAPGSLVAIFGSGLAVTTLATNGTPLPISLGAVEVTFGGYAAPLLYVSSGQINAQVPSEVPSGTVDVVVRVGGVVADAFQVTVQAASPGIFTVNDAAAALNIDGSLNSASHPAKAGSFLSVYLTGAGAVDPSEPDGAEAPVEQAPATIPNVTATIGGANAPVQFAGAAPGFVGLAQVNLTVPALPSGTYPLVIQVNGVSSNPASIFVTAQ